ncbi:MAG: hypothetical protein WC209_14865 [Ignavibacteriaceae bacterium]|jgi:hypothetical protein
MSGKAKRKYLDEIKKRYFTSTKLETDKSLMSFAPIAPVTENMQSD